MRGPAPELELAGGALVRPQAQVHLAERLELGRGHPQHVTRTREGKQYS